MTPSRPTARSDRLRPTAYPAHTTPGPDDAAPAPDAAIPRHLINEADQRLATALYSIGASGALLRFGYVRDAAGTLSHIGPTELDRPITDSLRDLEEADRVALATRLRTVARQVAPGPDGLTADVLDLVLAASAVPEPPESGSQTAKDAYAAVATALEGLVDVDVVQLDAAAGNAPND